MLKETFIELACKYSNDLPLKEKLWAEICKSYSEKNRHYHTLTHLENLINQLKEVKNKIHDWETILFAVFYHDIIYKTTGSKNEEESAELAKKRLMEIGFPKERAVKCCSIILATKGHTQTGDGDTDCFTDADLSVLGQNRDLYAEYARQIRKEYSIYPDFVYNPGRRKVLNRFLQMKRIFKTDYFFDRFETQAKENLLNELKT